MSLPDCEGRGSCQRGLGPSPRGAAGDQDRATIEGEPLATPAEYADSCSGERPRAVCQVHPDATHGISEMSGARCRLDASGRSAILFMTSQPFAALSEPARM